MARPSCSSPTANSIRAVAPALEELGPKRPIVVDIADAETDGAPSFGSVEYESFIADGDPEFAYPGPDDEWDSICLLYTSGTTGNPKGAVYSHRGAYLGALANAFTFKLDHDSRYLWTLPMFHCSGWTYTWAVTAAAGTHVCLRKVEPQRIFDSIVDNRVTHMCGAPIVLNMLVHAPAEAKRPLPLRTKVATGGAAPPAIVIERMEAMGFEVLHLYGTTESYGPSTFCPPMPEWHDASRPNNATPAWRARVCRSPSSRPWPWWMRTRCPPSRVTASRSARSHSPATR